MSDQPISLGPFDKGIFLLGGQEQVPQEFCRDMCGIAQVRYNSVRLRPPIFSIYNVPVISVWRNANRRFGLDQSGNIWMNGTALVGSGFTPGVRPIITKGPPAFGATSYVFLAGITANGKLWKIAPDGTFSYWGITEPVSGMTYTLGSAQTVSVISNLDTVGAISFHQGCNLSTDSTNYPTYNTADASSLGVAFTGTPCEIAFDVSGTNFDPGTGFIQFFYSPPNNQGNVSQIEVRFSDSGGFNYFSAFVPVAGITPGVEGNITAQQTGLLDGVSNSFFQDTNFRSNPNTGISTQIQSEFQGTLQTVWKNANTGGLTNNQQLGRPVFKPSPGALNNTNGAQVYIATLPAAEIVPTNSTRNQWWKIRLEQAAFSLVGTLTWAQVKTCEIFIYADGTAQPLSLFARMTLHTGGSGLFGAYQYVVTFGNSNTGSYSNPNVNPLQTQNVNRVPVNLANIPVSNDPQVNQRILWRTMGNGGNFYQLAIIPDNTTTTYTDTLADFYGEGGTGQYSTSVLSIIPLAQVNTPPPATLGAVLYYQGTLFGCADSANPGFLYYSALGYSEGFAGYTSVINDDDSTVGFGTWNNNAYLLSQKGLWLLVNNSTSPLQPSWTAVQVGGAPGCSDPQSIQSTSWGIIYRSSYGLMLFNSNILQSSDTIFAPVLTPLLRGESIEGYAAIGTIVASTFGRDEYYFSDGVGNTFAVSRDGSVRPIGVPTTALFYEWDTGDLVGGVDNRWCDIEHGAANSGGDFFDATAFTLQTRAISSGIKYQYKIARMFIDLETSAVETLQVQLVLKGLQGGGNSILSLGTFNTLGTGRQILDIPVNQTARVCSVRITGYILQKLEIYDVQIEADRKVEVRSRR